MGTINPINKLSIKGFKSIRKMNELHLYSLNVLIGANGVGKSNFVSYFRFLGEMLENRLQLWPGQLSDGSVRFICLVTALLQPDPPSTIIIDEPELGLNPYAITLLGGLLRSASARMQVIVSTQSVPLLNEFSIDDLIIVEREDEVSVFKRLDEDEFSNWINKLKLVEVLNA